ncbi:MAG TPA: hypothetical protein VFN97_24885 [Actinospica sp.]|nr:hypothetical protein [Actinospica sp.]
MDDASRRALRDLARRAEWRGHAGAAGAAQDADALRELGARLRAALQSEPDQDASAWGYQAAERLSAYCLKARADWTPEQVAELARLREDAMIALAPGPGESDALPPKARPGLTALASRQARLVALVAAGCVVLVVLLLLLPHFLSSGDSAEPAASTSTSAAPAFTTTTAFPTAPPSTAASATATSTSSASPSASSGASSSAGATSTGPASTSRVTGIQITNTDNIPGNPPEVILTYSVTTSGTGDALLYITVDGSVPTQLASMEPIDESGQTTYSNLTQTIDLSQWCGKTVTVAITAGSISKSVSVPVSGC